MIICEVGYMWCVRHKLFLRSMQARAAAIYFLLPNLARPEPNKFLTTNLTNFSGSFGIGRVSHQMPGNRGQKPGFLLSHFSFMRVICGFDFLAQCTSFSLVRDYLRRHNCAAFDGREYIFEYRLARKHQYFTG